MASLFTRIIQREIPAHIVAEDDQHIAFLDINPLVTGHTLVVPKRENDYLFDLTPEELSSLMVFAQKVAGAVRQSIPCKRIGVAVIGLEVPHTHVHLVPLNSLGDINFTAPKLHPSADDLAKTAELIRTAIP